MLIFDTLESRHNQATIIYPEKGGRSNRKNLAMKLLSTAIVGTTSALTAGVIMSVVFTAIQVLMAAIIGGVLGTVLIATCWISGDDPKR